MLLKSKCVKLVAGLSNLNRPLCVPGRTVGDLFELLPHPSPFHKMNT